MKNRDTDKARNNESTHSDGDRKPGRRRLLGALGLGGTAAFLPPFWHKPVVKGLILPAHAETSPPPGSLSFSDPCSVSLSFRPLGIGVAGCPGNEWTIIAADISGSVVGDGDLSGIEINIVSELNGFLDTPIETTVFTDAGGNYQIVHDHSTCTDAENCESNFPSGGEVLVTATSPDPRLTDQASCPAEFDCEDVSTATGSLAESGDRSTSTFYVEMTPVDPAGPKV